MQIQRSLHSLELRGHRCPLQKLVEPHHVPREDGWTAESGFRTTPNKRRTGNVLRRATHSTGGRVSGPENRVQRPPQTASFEPRGGRGADAHEGERRRQPKRLVRGEGGRGGLEGDDAVVRAGQPRAPGPLGLRLKQLVPGMPIVVATVKGR